MSEPSHPQLQPERPAEPRSLDLRTERRLSWLLFGLCLLVALLLIALRGPA